MVIFEYFPEKENHHGVLLYCHRKLEDKTNSKGFAKTLVLFANAPTGFSAFGDQRDTLKELKMENMDELEHCEGDEVQLDVEIGTKEGARRVSWENGKNKNEKKKAQK